MPEKKFLILLLVLLIAGCATVVNLRKMDKFNDTTMAYAKAVSWSDFAAASAFRKKPAGDAGPQDFQKFKFIRITQYVVQQSTVAEDKSQVTQKVEYSYYRVNYPVIKTVTETVVWQYDPHAGKWYIQGWWPDFK